jgi:hypothetical protein
MDSLRPGRGTSTQQRLLEIVGEDVQDLAAEGERRV